MDNTKRDYYLIGWYKKTLFSKFIYHCESEGTTDETPVMGVEEQPLVYLSVDGTPYMVKAVRTVWGRGKSGDYFKGLPIPMAL